MVTPTLGWIIFAVPITAMLYNAYKAWRDHQTKSKKTVHVVWHRMLVIASVVDIVQSVCFVAHFTPTNIKVGVFFGCLFTWSVLTLLVTYADATNTALEKITRSCNDSSKRAAFVATHQARTNAFCCMFLVDACSQIIGIVTSESLWLIIGTSCTLVIMSITPLRLIRTRALILHASKPISIKKRLSRLATKSTRFLSDDKTRGSKKMATNANNQQRRALTRGQVVPTTGKSSITTVNTTRHEPVANHTRKSRQVSAEAASRRTTRSVWNSYRSPRTSKGIAKTKSTSARLVVLSLRIYAIVACCVVGLVIQTLSIMAYIETPRNYEDNFNGGTVDMAACALVLVVASAVVSH